MLESSKGDRHECNVPGTMRRCLGGPMGGPPRHVCAGTSSWRGGCSITTQDEQEFTTQGWGPRNGHRGGTHIAVAVRLTHAKAQTRGGTAHVKIRGTVRLSIECRGKIGEKARQQVGLHVWHTQELNRGR